MSDVQRIPLRTSRQYRSRNMGTRTPEVKEGRRAGAGGQRIIRRGYLKALAAPQLGQIPEIGSILSGGAGVGRKRGSSNSESKNNPPSRK